MKMRLVVLILAAGLAGDVVAETNTCSFIVELREQMSRVIAEIPEMDRDSDYIAQMGLRVTDLKSYSGFAASISNHMDIITNIFTYCATNQLERYVLMSAGWYYDDDYYLRYYDHIASLGISGALTVPELKWYRCAHLDDRRMNILALCYERPIVSNIVMKLECLTGDTNRFNQIRRGAARLTYLSISNETHSLKRGSGE